MRGFDDFIRTIERVGSFGKNLQNKGNAIAEYSRKSSKIGYTLSSIVENINFPDMTNKEIFGGLERLRQGFIETERDIQAFKIIIIELGYPPHEHMDIRTIRNLVSKYRDGEGVEVDDFDNFMCAYYVSSKLMSISETWERLSFLSERLPILRNVIMAHNLGMYGVSVPALVSQFEGVLVDGYKVKGFVDGRKIATILDDLLTVKEEQGVWDFNQEIHNYYKENLLVRFEHGKEIESDLSRNGILHGGDKFFNKEQVSLKAVLLFDYIANKLNENVEKIK
ncbi:hypothetical protein [Oceanobacillus kimchii]|uniref:DUF4145 domain-containing protein n=1 Tax=Oceanobacillus kimchii TaxID=746691 RepID=A0ABQ5TJA6_9BACI|nr:hypothetical protein [Oceanobacillus kimchii]GLO66187.1 hypothetical protein MACH08_19710 [Oceanobacillus kimchii]